MDEAEWKRALPAADLAPGEARTVKLGSHQIALIRGDDGELYAVDNRCPHEGYPLASGLIKDGTVTCEWHNWKFRLCDGECIKGGEDVRRYPVRVEAGAIWLDVAEPPPGRAIPALERSLAEAFDEQDWSQAARAVERLLTAGHHPMQILALGCVWAAERAPDGFDHGLAAAADLAELCRLEAGEPGHILLEALNLLIDPHARRPARERPAARPARGLEAELRRAIEDEQADAADGLVRGAVADGTPPEALFGALARAAGDHFLDYGHAEIYTVKAAELLGAIGWQHADPIAGSLATAITFGTREDRLPYMRAFQRQVAGWRPVAAGDGAPDAVRLVAAVVDGDLAAAVGAVAGELERGAAPDRIALALAVAAGVRLLRFDAELEHDDAIAEGWLDVTHCLTHADAVREIARRHPHADVQRSLLYAARFIQHLHPLDAPPARRASAGAIAGTDPDRLRRDVLADRAVLPIFYAHHVKTTMAAIRLDAAVRADPALASLDQAGTILAAARRFLDSPLRERRIGRNAAVARRFVHTGRRQDNRLGY